MPVPKGNRIFETTDVIAHDIFPSTRKTIWINCLVALDQILELLDLSWETTESSAITRVETQVHWHDSLL